jgi:hypothetical protein
MKKPGISTVGEYLNSLPEERKESLGKIRDRIVKNLPNGFAEGFSFGMIGYFIPLERYPDTYNKQPLMLAALGSHKNYLSLYLMSVYGDPGIEKWFKDEYAKSGKKLKMGKSCINFKDASDLPMDLIGEVIRKVSVEDFIRNYETVREASRKK